MIPKMRWNRPVTKRATFDSYLYKLIQSKIYEEGDYDLEDEFDYYAFRVDVIDTYNELFPNNKFITTPDPEEMMNIATEIRRDLEKYYQFYIPSPLNKTALNNLVDITIMKIISDEKMRYRITKFTSEEELQQALSRAIANFTSDYIGLLEHQEYMTKGYIDTLGESYGLTENEMNGSTSGIRDGNVRHKGSNKGKSTDERTNKATSIGSSSTCTKAEAKNQTQSKGVSKDSSSSTGRNQDTTKGMNHPDSIGSISLNDMNNWSNSDSTSSNTSNSTGSTSSDVKSKDEQASTSDSLSAQISENESKGSSESEGSNESQTDSKNTDKTDTESKGKVKSQAANNAGRLKALTDFLSKNVHLVTVLEKYISNEIFSMYTEYSAIVDEVIIPEYEVKVIHIVYDYNEDIEYYEEIQSTVRFAEAYEIELLTEYRDRVTSITPDVSLQGIGGMEIDKDMEIIIRYDIPKSFSTYDILHLVKQKNSSVTVDEKRYYVDIPYGDSYEVPLWEEYEDYFDEYSSSRRIITSDPESDGELMVYYYYVDGIDGHNKYRIIHDVRRGDEDGEYVNFKEEIISVKHGDTYEVTLWDQYEEYFDEYSSDDLVIYSDEYEADFDRKYNYYTPGYDDGINVTVTHIFKIPSWDDEDDEEYEYEEVVKVERLHFDEPTENYEITPIEAHVDEYVSHWPRFIHITEYDNGANYDIEYEIGWGGSWMYLDPYTITEYYIDENGDYAEGYTWEESNGASFGEPYDFTPYGAEEISGTMPMSGDKLTFKEWTEGYPHEFKVLYRVITVEVSHEILDKDGEFVDWASEYYELNASGDELEITPIVDLDDYNYEIIAPDDTFDFGTNYVSYETVGRGTTIEITYTHKGDD